MSEEFQLLRRRSSGSETRPDEGGGGMGSETLQVSNGETMGGLKAKPGRAPVVTAAFAELEGSSTAEH